MACPWLSSFFCGCWPARKWSLRGLSGDLRDGDDHKLGRLEQRYRDYDIHHSVLLIRTAGWGRVALDLECLTGCRALQRLLVKQQEHEGLDRAANRQPQRLIIGLEDHPF